MGTGKMRQNILQLGLCKHAMHRNSQHEEEDGRLISDQTLTLLFSFSGSAWLIPLSLTVCSYPPVFDPHVPPTDSCSSYLVWEQYYVAVATTSPAVAANKQFIHAQNIVSSHVLTRMCLER